MAFRAHPPSLALGLDPGALLYGARKATCFNEALGATVNRALYPTPAERRRFAQAIVDIRSRTRATR